MPGNEKIDDDFGTRDEFKASDWTGLVPLPGALQYDGPPTLDLSPDQIATEVGIDPEDAPLFLAIGRGKTDGDVVRDR